MTLSSRYSLAKVGHKGVKDIPVRGKWYKALWAFRLASLVLQKVSLRMKVKKQGGVYQSFHVALSRSFAKAAKVTCPNLSSTFACSRTHLRLKILKNVMQAHAQEFLLPWQEPRHLKHCQNDTEN